MNSFIHKSWSKMLCASLVIAAAIIVGIILQRFFAKTDLTQATVSCPTTASLNTTASQITTGPTPFPMTAPFIESTPITYHVAKYKEFPIGNSQVSELKVSPDGNRIVFVKETGGKSSLAILDLPRDKVTSLDYDLDAYASPSWNADGSKITFAGLKDAAWEIYIGELKSSKIKAVTNDPKRSKLWPRFSPYKFSDNYRIAYVSEENGRNDIWWVRESGEYDQPITLPSEKTTEYKQAEYWKHFDGIPPFITQGGDKPEWSPSGDFLLYKTARGYALLNYSYGDWWKGTELPTPMTAGVLSWAPNQTRFLEYDPQEQKAALISRDNLNQRIPIAGRAVTAISYFPDGRAFAYSLRDKEQTVIAVKPFNDPLGDISNLWMFDYTGAQKAKLARNQLLLLNTKHDQIYSLYETEAYYCGSPDPYDHAKPYLVTSDAVLETFYSAFAALYASAEQTALFDALKEFSQQAARVAREQNAGKDAETLFQTGLILLKPDSAETASPQAVTEALRVEKAAGEYVSLFGQELNYSDFFIRGKYERDTAMQGYFRAVKWYQAFTFDPEKADDRKSIATLLPILTDSKVRPSLERIYGLYRGLLGESRHYSPLDLKGITIDEKLPRLTSELPWVQVRKKFKIFPAIYTLDANVFDDLVTHLDRPKTVGTAESPRMLPKGLDIMAAMGSEEAFNILVKELKENRYANYEDTLLRIKKRIRDYSAEAWDANLYQNWLAALRTLIREPAAGSPAFTKTKAWKRKQLNTALGSWVNLRYETIAMAEQVAAECGEGGYESITVGLPKGYVEPNPEFFQQLDHAFDKLSIQLGRVIGNRQLRSAALSKIKDYRVHIRKLETISRKELAGQELSYDEYTEIFTIGRALEHFILLMGSLSGSDEEHAIRIPDPIMKIVDIQKDNNTGKRLYEALGYANEVNAAVPFYGRRQIAKGSIYSYYEFTSGENLDSRKWRESLNRQPPIWLQDLYEGKAPKPQ